ncbi:MULTISPECIES: YeiH family protein [Brevundimonas]|uniref:YeiH family protein n=1 Tax=Brevundimonas TaxID=41275 RepID=UPI001903884C|nr:MULTISPECIES: putative sulfate exporter family transporter [Brevundimonas]MBK1970684.1 putative sulfate exporter family transporter [Brevundimonas diminuta]MBK1975950.1 putative sulfate exporter family transporter [Brevundimonas diminuta]MDA0744847.1 putative sulfate exporter family transporter [Pseudomonadota bacterium]MDM8352324.1 putative sulfate exporter family transporter [Brevundimonas diminuta]
MTVALAPAASPCRLTGLARLLPGVALSAAIGAVAYGLQIVETRLFEQPWIEGLVLAILIGAGLRLVWTPSSLWTPGVAFSAKTLLEVAVALLGATVSGAAVVALGPWLLLAIVGVVAVAIVGGYALGRAFGLPHAMALLVACGNAICGNSAIAAVAPVIEAEGEDVAAAIGFTAVLGVAVVLLVPAVGAMMGYDAARVGVLAGLTVYAVPQVLAAAAPASLAAVQTGAVVKLVRVLMLGPVCLVLGLMRSKQSEAGRGPKLHQMAPWFILVFLVLMAVRSLGWLPEAILPPLQASVSALTLIAMAALGLMVDPRAVARAGPRVAAVAALSALLIGLLALAVIAFLPLG